MSEQAGELPWKECSQWHLPNTLPQLPSIDTRRLRSVWRCIHWRVDNHKWQRNPDVSENHNHTTQKTCRCSQSWGGTQDPSCRSHLTRWFGLKCWGRETKNWPRKVVRRQSSRHWQATQGQPEWTRTRGSIHPDGAPCSSKFHYRQPRGWCSKPSPGKSQLGECS